MNKQTHTWTVSCEQTDTYIDSEQTDTYMDSEQTDTYMDSEQTDTYMDRLKFTLSMYVSVHKSVSQHRFR